MNLRKVKCMTFGTLLISLQTLSKVANDFQNQGEVVRPTLLKWAVVIFISRRINMLPLFSPGK